MKYLIFIFSTVLMLSSLTTASESLAAQDFASAPILALVPQRAPAASEMAMGPTSAPQKSGGVGQEPQQQTPKVHKKTKHKYTAS
jgi:hypothetical protein